jgi:hypothetical protein
VTTFQATYTELELARANYNVVTDRCIDYLSAVERFMNPPDHQITRQGLAAVLASERLYIEVSSEYANKLIENIERTTSLETTVSEGATRL